MFPHCLSVISSQTNLCRLAFPSKLVANESHALGCVCRAAYYYHIFIRRYRASVRVGEACGCWWAKRLFDARFHWLRQLQRRSSEGSVWPLRLRSTFLWMGLSYGWILRRFLYATSPRYTHKHTHHKISDWMAIHTAVHFSTFMFIFGMFDY